MPGPAGPGQLFAQNAGELLPILRREPSTRKGLANASGGRKRAIVRGGRHGIRRFAVISQRSLADRSLPGFVGWLRRTHGGTNGRPAAQTRNAQEWNRLLGRMLSCWKESSTFMRCRSLVSTSSRTSRVVLLTNIPLISSCLVWNQGLTEQSE